MMKKCAFTIFVFMLLTKCLHKRDCLTPIDVSIPEEPIVQKYRTTIIQNGGLVICHTTLRL